MRFHLSDFGSLYQNDSGIFLLMEDLDQALNQNPNIYMLGGGNPGFIAEIQEYFYKKFKLFLENKKDFFQSIGIYDSPLGNVEFRKELAGFFNHLWSWDISEDHIAIMQGSQNAFFILLNIFSGWSKQLKQTLKVYFPLVPEYIGYENIPIQEDAVISTLGKRRQVDNYHFYYELDKDEILKTIETDGSIGCMIISNPTNPTGKVFSLEELRFLKTIADDYRIPVILDFAYGEPFPGIVYKKQEFLYSENFIYVFSFSKTGLPGLRAGFVIANPDIISIIGRIQAIHHLAPSRIASFVLKGAFENLEFYHLCSQYIKPFYEKRRNLALSLLTKYFSSDEIQIHQSEGAFFVWVEFPKLKIPIMDLYEILKKHSLIIVPGKFYFVGNSAHANETKAIRISFSQAEETIEKGIEILAKITKSYIDTSIQESILK
ncbi:MAG: aminotransferase class I/II-fold pyridoxal phosphate-dependent enzyme [Leptospiraceae bacterium]|nr:aminotransferase class I/II-fold pyridoxal phosphate-dependent enzyme [Leptospiraceae bacterium]MDW7975993.1 aminotransferase class I/II-fold pyridoxal phosphate-dependent enzyme [Leptospiraceae bacterium]